MTKAELEKEAEESFEQYKVTDEDYVVSPYSDDMGEKMLMYNDEYYAEETYLRLYTHGYIAGATEATKELQEEIKACKFAMAMSEKVEKQLREQIEKMKNCNNCCNFEKDEDGLWNCKKGSFFCNCMGKGCKEWELAE